MSKTYVYRGFRYWTMEPTGDEQGGWNTRFIPYEVIKTTAKRITVTGMANGMWQTVNLNRAEFELVGHVYHSRFHEYFYQEIPPRDSEPKPRVPRMPKVTNALIVLGLHAGATKAEIKAAFKKKARATHPDVGGNHEAFIALKAAYDAAISGL